MSPIMMRSLLRAKLHSARVTEANLEYMGSITIDRDLLDAVGLVPNEQVLVANLANGERFTTYVFEGERGSGVMCVNGAASRLARVGDRIIVMAFGLFTEDEVAAHLPKVAILDTGNRIERML
jgi:aspartate 1-decarboxylase